MVRLHWSGGPLGYLAFTAVFAVAAALVAVGPAFVEAVGDDLAIDAAATVSSDEALVTLQGFAQFTPDLVDATATFGASLGQLDGLRDPISTFALGSPGTTARSGDAVYGGVTIFTRSGAIEALTVVADGGPATGVMVSERLAGELGVSPGDELIVANRLWSLPTAVRAIYEDIFEAPGPYWLGIPGELLPQTRAVFGGRVEPELLVAGEEALSWIVARGAVRPDADVDEQEPVQLTQGRVWFQGFLGAIDGVADLRQLADAVSGLEGRAQDPSTDLGRAVAIGGIDDLTLRTSLFDLRERVEEALDLTEPAIGVVAITGGLVGLVVVILGAWFVATRRRRDLQIWSVEGRSPAAVALLSGTGAAPAAVGGTVLGALAAPAAVRWLGPSDIAHPDAIPVGLLTGFVIVGLAAVATTTALVAAGVKPVKVSGRSRWMWDLALYGGAVLLVAQALVRSGGIDAGELDLVTLLVPLAAITAVVAAGLRVLSLALAGGRSRGSGLSAPLLLAWRRTTAALGSRLGIMLPIGIATGVALFASTLVAATDTALENKSRVVVGGDVAIATVDRVDASPAGSVLVRASSASTQTGSRVWLVVLDPDGYGDAVGWPESFGDVDALLEVLAPSPDARVPAVAAGPGADSLAPTGAARFQAINISYEIQDTVGAIPLMSAVQPTIVMRSDSLAGWVARNPLAIPVFVDLDEIDLSVLLRGMQGRLIADYDDAPAVRSALESSGVRIREVTTRAEVTSQPAYASQRWAFDFLHLVALATLVLSFAVLGFAMSESRKRLVVAEALTRRMGIGGAASSAALALEIGAMVAVSMVMGALAAGGFSLLLLDRFDPLPQIRPALEAVVPGAGLIAVGAIGIVLAGLTWAWSQVATNRVDPAEVLRG